MVKSRWPLGIPSRKAPWFGVWRRCCCCQKGVDVEVPKRAKVHEKIFSAMYIQAMPCAVQQVDGGENVL
jgi:hypothetical protein